MRVDGALDMGHAERVDSDQDRGQVAGPVGHGGEFACRTQPQAEWESVNGCGQVWVTRVNGGQDIGQGVGPVSHGGELPCRTQQQSG